MGSIRVHPSKQGSYGVCHTFLRLIQPPLTTELHRRSSTRCRLHNIRTQISLPNLVVVHVGELEHRHSPISSRVFAHRGRERLGLQHHVTGAWEARTEAGDEVKLQNTFTAARIVSPTCSKPQSALLLTEPFKRPTSSARSQSEVIVRGAKHNNVNVEVPSEFQTAISTSPTGKNGSTGSVPIPNRK